MLIPFLRNGLLIVYRVPIDIIRILDFFAIAIAVKARHVEPSVFAVAITGLSTVRAFVHLCFTFGGHRLKFAKANTVFEVYSSSKTCAASFAVRTFVIRDKLDPQTGCLIQWAGLEPLWLRFIKDMAP